jgi:phosphate acetyltransferase
MITNKTYDEISVGDSASMERTLTKKDIDLFGVLSGDLNPTHFSDAYAEMLLERQKVVGHSMWGGALVSSLLGNDLPGPGTVYDSQSFTFHGAVELGDTVTVTVTVQKKIAQGPRIIFDCRVVNQRGEKIITGTARVKPPVKKPVDAGSPWLAMEFHRKERFTHFIEKVVKLPPISVAVCHPCSEDALLGALSAAREKIIDPILVGPSERIRALAEKLSMDINGFRMVDTRHSHESASRAVALCRGGEAEALMKGSLHTDEFMRAVAQKDTGLRTDKRISHIFIMEVPTYPRPLFITDAAINIYPTLEDKVSILKNAISLAQALGIETPKVAILSAVENVNPRIASTLEAAALCKMVDRGQITGAVVDGPLAFDNAISGEAARIKGIVSPVSGEADIFLVPDLEAGNMLAKQLTYLVKADSAGVVMGARVPIILTSRADSAQARLASCAVAAAFAHSTQGGNPTHKEIRL